MPAPVTFNLSLAPLPANANNYTPQQWAQAVVDRLTIAPSAPWSSFQNGGSIPSSDVGPILFNGMQWKVWDSGAGEYVDLVVEGGGLVSRTVELNALADQSPGGVLYYDAAGHADILASASGVTGDVITLAGSGLPVWQTLPAPVTSAYFEVNLSGNFDVTTDATHVALPFNIVKNQANVAFDTALYRVPVTAGSVWFFWANIEFSRTTTDPSTDVQISVEVRPNGNSNVGVGGFTGYTADQGQTGVSCSGVLPFVANGYADCSVAVLELTPVANGITVYANVSLTRFGGFRIF